MSARSIRFTLIGPRGNTRTVVQDALRLEFPGAVVMDASSIQDAMLQNSFGVEVLVLARPTGSDAATAAGATDEIGLPRWALVILGEDLSGQPFAAIPPEQWDAPSLARVFHTAVVQHHLARENARLRGDLLSLSRRLFHDLRTPAGCILTTSELVKETLAAEAPAHAPLIQPILDSADDLIKLVNRISFVVKASASPVPCDYVNMGNAYTAARQRLERQIRSVGARISEPDSWPEAFGVPSWLEEVWRTMLMNALQHGCRKENPKIEAGWNKEDGGYRFWIRDYGPGLAAEKIDSIFFPFHQLYQPNAPSALGLSIMRRLVDLQSGRVGYEPAAGGGARFFFTLSAPNETQL